MVSAISAISTVTCSRIAGGVAPPAGSGYSSRRPLLSEFLEERPTPTTRQVSSGDHLNFYKT